MANLTFADLQNEVYAHTGLDSTDATNQANVNRWINYVQQDVCARWPWTFMEGRESVVTIPDYITGTISISTGSPTVTGSGTTFTTAMGNGQYYIQFSTARDWYRISAYNSATSLTIEQNYQQSANISGGTFVLRKFYYSLSASADRIIDIRNWNTPMKLTDADARTLDYLYPNPQSTNSSYGYIAWGIDSSGNIQVSPYPFPSDSRLLELRTKKRPVDMSVVADSPSIPNKYAHLISWGALSIGFAFIRNFDAAKSWGANYEARIGEMKKEYRTTEDLQPVLRSIDQTLRTKWLNFPDQYPTLGGA